MGETSDPMNRAEDGRASRARMPDTADDMAAEIDIVEIVALDADADDDDVTDRTGSGGATDPETLRNDIEQTRAQMSGTIDEIQERLNPTRLINEAKETVRDATVGKVTGMMSSASKSAEGLVERIKENPMTAAMIGVGAWWLLNRLPGSSSTRSSYARRYGNDSSDYDARDEQYGWSQHGGDTRRVSEMAHDASAAISDYTSRGQQRVSEMTEQAESQFNRWMRDNPLAVGAAAIAVGAAIGLAVPATDRERELVGETRDQLMEKAQEVATQKIEQVTSALPAGDGGGPDAKKAGF
jgi:hypothetical protein